MELKIEYIYTLVILSIVFGVIDYLVLLTKKQSKFKDKKTEYSEYLIKKYNKTFDIIGFEKNVCICKTKDVIGFKIFKIGENEYVDNLYKSIAGYKMSEYIKENVKFSDYMVINTRINCLDGVLAENNLNIDKLLALSNENKFITTILIGVCLNKSEKDVIIKDIEKQLDDLNIKNLDSEVLIVDIYDRELLKNFVNEYNMSDGDVKEYSGNVIHHYYRKIK